LLTKMALFQHAVAGSQRTGIDSQASGWGVL
jgi:hypothetical protein